MRRMRKLQLGYSATGTPDPRFCPGASRRPRREPDFAGDRNRDTGATRFPNRSGSAPAALAYLRAIYAPVVAAVLGEKQRYLHRWPDRATWPASAGFGPQIRCTDSSAECEISGERAFANANPTTRAHAAGRFSYAYRVRFRGGAAQIVAEASTVLARQWQ